MGNDNPYRLPEGNVAIAFSGGRTSALMLREILRVNGSLPKRTVVAFQNTGREMPETLDFVAEVADRWTVPVVWLEYRPEKPFFRIVDHASASREGEPFEALIRKRRMLPNRVARFCTADLKVHTQSRYLRSLGWDRWTCAVGIRADEPSRLKSGTGSRERWSDWRPLAAAGVARRDVAGFWARQPFDLRLPHVDGRTRLGNCDGCFLKSEAALAALARDHPERAAWWERMERNDFGRRTGGGVFDHRRPRAGLHAFVRRQGDWIFDTSGALCQADDGECV